MSNTKSLTITIKILIIYVNKRKCPKYKELHAATMTTITVVSIIIMIIMMK